MHVRTNAESIAFANGGHKEAHQSQSKLAELLNCQEEVIARQYPLNVSTNLFGYFGMNLFNCFCFLF